MKGRALLAWNIRRLRAERGISQARLAIETQTDRAYMSEIENERGNPTVDLLDKLAKVLDAPLAEFFQAPEPGAKRPRRLPAGRPKTKT